MRSVVIASILVLAGCTSSKQLVVQMAPIEALGQLRNDFAVLWDVRDVADIMRTGTAQMAMHVPSQDWETHAAKLSKNKLVIVYDDGESDPRAERVAQYLAQKGLRVAILPGFEAWKAARLPVKITQ